MTLRNQNDPVVVIGEEKSEFKGKPWVEDDKVVVYENCGHILHNLASTQV